MAMQKYIFYAILGIHLNSRKMKGLTISKNIIEY